ncbi:MAG: TetR family transcriptional regulator [Rhodobacterales bacterium]|nr:TetR family transcriptional regulator [Rhodobacterales bacterium]
MSKSPFALPTKSANIRGARSIQRIVEAAARMFGKEGFQGASMHSVARAAGVSKGLLHYHFRSKEHLLIEAQRATFRQIHRRFIDRFEQGERGLDPALEALDALFQALLDLHQWAPFMVETMSMATHDGPLKQDVEAFYQEAMGLLLEGIHNVFEHDLARLAVPPQRLARMVRTGMHGLVVELAIAQTPEAIDDVKQTYADLRRLFAQSALRAPLAMETS